MLNNKTKDAASQLKALAAGYQAVIDLAEGVDSLVAVQGHLAELEKIKEAKIKEVADVDAVLGARQAVLAEVENKVIELEDKASILIEEAKKNAHAIERTAVFDAKTLTDGAREEAAMIVKAAQNDAAVYDSKTAVAKNKLAKIESDTEAARAELADIEAKKLAAVQYVKDALGV